MRSYKLLAAAALCALAAAALSLSAGGAGRRPFRDLEPSSIASATVTLSPPDQTLLLQDLGELTDYLREAIIYEEDNSYPDYAGQAVTFTLFLTDGSQRTVTACSPFLVVDGVGYRTAHAPCEALNAYANRLLQEGDLPVVLEEPPALSVVSDDTAVAGCLGSYHWQRRAEGGAVEALLADSPHPLSCRELVTPLDTWEPTARLRFAQAPDAIVSARCWSGDCWGDPRSESQAADLRGDTLSLKPGGWIYQVEARWEPESGWGGAASYFFYVDLQA